MAIAGIIIAAGIIAIVVNALTGKKQPTVYTPGERAAGGQGAAPMQSPGGQHGQPGYVIVQDVNMTFGSMVVFMVKWALASIPALIILLVIGAAAISFLASLGLTLAR